MKIRNSFIVGVIAIFTSSVHADTLYGLYTDFNYWNTSITNAGQDLGNEDQLMFSVSVEHGAPILPNIKAKYADLNTTKHNDKKSVDANTTDLVAYYEVLDNVVSADLGLGAKNLKVGNEIDQIAPMAYASVGAKLPLTGLSTKAEVSLAKKKNIEVRDAQAEIKYNFVDNLAVDLGAKVGYRVIETEVDKEKVDFKGPYLGMEVHF